jgi:hypothetical protein
MSLDFKKLNVASLNYADIISSLKTFLKSEPTLNSLDFDNEASACSLLCNILATGVAYNGVYSQFGYNESFLSTASLLSSVVGLASNGSVLLELKKSAKTTRSVSITGTDLEKYTPFTATSINGSKIFFFNMEGLSAGTSASLTLYSGIEVAQYTDWDFNTQSITIPLSVDPESIYLYSTDPAGVETQWTRVDKTNFVRSTGNYFTVLNTVNGYLVTANLPESANIGLDQVVYVRAVVSNGVEGNGAEISAPSNLSFLTNNRAAGGYDSISVSLAKAKTQFSISAENRCVTIEDYENAILQSGIDGTDNIDNITVVNGDVPCQIKIYVDGLTVGNQSALMTYLGTKAVAGINLIYST